MLNKTQLIIIISIAIIFFAAGYAFSFLVKSAPAGENTFQAGWEAAQKRLAETGFAPAMVGIEIKTLSGEVKEIKGNKINLKIRPLEPLAEPGLDIRTIIVDNSTKIYKLDAKDPNEFQKEMAEYNKKMQEQMKKPAVAAQPLMMPEPFVKKEAKLSDLKAGQQITVSTDKDIKNVQEFKAVEITLQSVILSPPAPAGTPIEVELP